MKVDADSDFTSLYALCRQWLKNDIPRKKQVNCMIEYPYILEYFKKAALNCMIVSMEEGRMNHPQKGGFVHYM